MNIFIMFCVYASVVLNTCLAIDLILMIKYPFKVKEKRLPRYFAATIVIAGGMAFWVLWTVSYRTEYGTYLPNKTVAIASVLLFVIYLIASLTSVIYAFRMKQGISAESQKMVLGRHVISIIAFLIAQFYMTAGIIYLFMNGPNQLATSLDKTWADIAKILFVT